MNALTAGFILGWLGLVCSYHLAPPVNPPIKTKTTPTTTTTPPPTPTTVPVEYEAPEIEGPVSTTTTVAPTTPTTTTTTTTTKRPTSHAYGHGPPPVGYYDQYGQYHYYTNYNTHNDPYGAHYDPYRRPSSQAPYPSHAPHPSQAPYGSGAQSPYTDPYAPQYDPGTGHYSDPSYGGKDPYFRGGQGLKPNGQSALMDQLSITKPPQPSASPSPYEHSGRWIELRPANELRIKSRRQNRQDATRRRGYIPRGEQQRLKRISPSGSRNGGTQPNWQNKQQPRRRQQQGAFRRRGKGGKRRGQGRRKRPNAGYNARGYQQPRDSASSAGGISQPSAGYPASAFRNQTAPANNNMYNTNTASASNAYANPASQFGNTAVQPSPYPNSASAQFQSSNYDTQGVGAAYNQGQRMETSANAQATAYNTGLSSNQGANYYNTATNAQQGYNNYGTGATGTGAGTGTGTGTGAGAGTRSAAGYYTPAPPASGYNSQGTYNYNTAVVSAQQQAYYNDPNTAKQGSGVDTFGLGNQGPSYNYDATNNNQAMTIGNYDASGNQMQTDAYNTGGSWGGQNAAKNTQMSPSNWNAGNSFGQAQNSHAATGTSVGYMSMNNANSASASKTSSSKTSSASTGSSNSGSVSEQSVAQTMIKMLQKMKTAAAANTSSSNSLTSIPPKANKQEPVQFSQSMEAAIKNAIINAAKDITNTMAAKQTPTYVGTQETHQLPPSLQALDTSFQAAVTSPFGWAQPPTTTAQTWTQAPPTTAAPAAAHGQWGPTGGLWEPSALMNYYQVTMSPSGRVGGPVRTPAPTTPSVSFLGAMNRKRSSITSTMAPRINMNPMNGLQQMLFASAFFNKK